MTEQQHDPQSASPTAAQTYTPPTQPSDPQPQTVAAADVYRPTSFVDPARPQPTPAQVEAEGIETIDVQWRGQTFTVPAASDDWPIAVTLAFERGQGALALHTLLGPRRFAELQRQGLRTRDLTELTELILKQYGLGSSGE